MYKQHQLSVLVIVLIFASFSNSLIHDLKIKDDRRKWFFIENFGFEAHGRLELTVKNFLVSGVPIVAEDIPRVGFVIKVTETDSTAYIEESPNPDKECTDLEWAKEAQDILVSVNSSEVQHTLTINAGEEGFYNTYFVSCLDKRISFELVLVQYNVDSAGNRNYLSAGYSPLPTLYGIFTLVYVVVLMIWVFNFVRASHSQVNRIHHLMTLFLFLKIMSLLFKTIEQHFIKISGSASGWNVVYYIFTGLKGTMLFILIVLLGSGWSFIKPFLSEKEKKIFLVVIPLQLLDNIALIIIEETAPGSQEWLTWKDIFRLIDFICCAAIIIPIVWSIKHLRDASQIDGKAARNLQKLKLFRQFYIMVISYIYFTRFIVFLVDATLPFRFVWLGDLFLEGATLCFFVVTGYKFRPTPDNPYFALELEDIPTTSPE